MIKLRCLAMSALVGFGPLVCVWATHLDTRVASATRSVEQIRAHNWALQREAALEPWLAAELATITSNADAYAAVAAPELPRAWAEHQLCEAVFEQLERAQIDMWGGAKRGRRLPEDRIVPLKPGLDLVRIWFGDPRWSLYAPSFEHLIRLFLGIERSPDRWIDAFEITPGPFCAGGCETPQQSVRFEARVAALRTTHAHAPPAQFEPPAD